MRAAAIALVYTVLGEILVGWMLWESESALGLYEWVLIGVPLGTAALLWFRGRITGYVGLCVAASLSLYFLIGFVQFALPLTLIPAIGSLAAAYFLAREWVRTGFETNADRAAESGGLSGGESHEP